ncbi:hypothetical protein GCM10027053_15990 [Intrasporangium mesophilum]
MEVAPDAETESRDNLIRTQWSGVPIMSCQRLAAAVLGAYQTLVEARAFRTRPHHAWQSQRLNEMSSFITMSDAN